MELETFEKRSRNSVAESTVKSRMSALRSLRNFIDEDREPIPEDVAEWMDHLIEKYENDEIKSGTMKQYYKAVRYYFRMMGHDADAIEHIREWIPEGETNHGEYLTEEEWTQLIGSIYNYRDHAFFRIMYDYGRRPGEVRLLNMQDIDFDEGTITFIILKKADTLRATFEMTDKTRDALNTYLEYRIERNVPSEHEWEDGKEVEPLFTTSNGRISYDTIWKKAKAYTAKAQIDKNITPGSMRHTRATHLDWQGFSPGEIARHQLVHAADTDVISSYIHDREEEQVRSVLSAGMRDEESED